MRPFLFWLATLLAVGAALPARPARAEATAVIEAGRETEVLALLSPYRLTDEVAPGWKLWNVSIRATEIDLELKGPDASSAHLSLVHPARATPEAERSPSFGLVRDELARGAASPAAAALIARVKANDPGGFWHDVSPPPRARTEPAPKRRSDDLRWPIALAALSAGGMWLVARRGRKAS